MKVILDIESLKLICEVLLIVIAAHNNPECPNFGQEIDKLKMILKNVKMSENDQ